MLYKRMDDNMDISTKLIIEFIEKRGLTKAQVEKNCGLSNGSIGKWQKGEYKPSYGAIVKIADYFNVPKDYFLGKMELDFPEKENVMFLCILDRIIKTMKEKGVSQKQLCEYIGVSKQAFTEWKGGRNESYKKYLPQIAEFLNCSVDYLLGRTDEPIPEKTRPVVLMAKGGDGQEVIEISEEQYNKIKKILQLMDDEI